MTQTQLQTFSFHGDALTTFKVDDVPHIAMRPIVESLGLAWQVQSKKINAQKVKFSCNHMVTTGADGKNYSMLSMPAKKLSLWLATINPNKIKDVAKRRKIEMYQEECAEALYNYWHHGVAIKDDYEGMITGIDPKVMQALGGMMKGIVSKAVHELVPVLVQSQLADSEFGIVHGVTSYDVSILAGVPANDRKGLSGLSRFITGRLSRYHAKHGVAVKMRDYGSAISVRVYDKAAAKDWLRSGGKFEVEGYVKEKRGQTHLKLATSR